MIRTLTFSLALVGSATSLLACASTPDVVDELAGETSLDGEEGKGDAVDAFTFFTVSPDVRQCSLDASCGGFYVSRPNRATTICGRGNVQKRCYVDGIDWSGTAMPASVAASYEERLRAGETILIRGDIAPAANDAGATLAASEIWVARSPVGAIDGVFVLAKDNGVRCITAPCPSVTETRLNSNRSAALAEVDFEPSGADQDAIDLGSNALWTDGVILVGDRFYGSRNSKGRTANQFFTRAPVPLH